METHSTVRQEVRLDAEEMMGGEDFTQRSGTARVKTYSLYQVMKGFMIDRIEG